MSAGRPRIDGIPRKYVVADDVHDWIKSHGGGKYINDTIRVIMAVSK